MASDRAELVLLGSKGPGSRLRLEVSALRERPDLYPLPVVVEVDGQRVGEIVIERPSPHDGAAPPRLAATFDLPDLGGAPACDVKLIPARYAVEPDRRKWGEVSFRLHSIACVER